MPQNSANKWINTFDPPKVAKKEPLILASIDFFKMIEFNSEEFSLGILKKEKLLDQITPQDFNEPQTFSKDNAPLLHFLLKENKPKLLNYLLKYSHIDYSKMHANETLVQAAIHHSASYKTLYTLVKNTPKEFLKPMEELPFLMASNSYSRLNNKSFKNVIEEYVNKFQKELTEINIERKGEKMTLLTFAHKMWSHDALTVLLEANLFTKEQIEQTMIAPINDPFPEDFFMPYIIKLEKEQLEKSLTQPEIEKKKLKL